MVALAISWTLSPDGRMMIRNPSLGAVMDVVVWLRSLGLGKYEAAFRENEIDETVLPNLTAEDLKELGVAALGHRRKLLDAIAALRNDATGNPSVDATASSSTPSPHPEDRAERRQVTVMFSDLVGSTALSTRMDPEDLREVISVYQKCVAETVGRFGGFVAKYMGDGGPHLLWLPTGSRGRRSYETAEATHGLCDAGLCVQGWSWWLRLAVSKPMRPFRRASASQRASWSSAT
jgi:hypothetical protein